MKHSTIVTEGEDEQLLLQALLDIGPDDTNVRIIAAGGWSSGDSLARSLLVRGEESVALVVDADTTDPDLVEERKRFLRGSLGAIAPSTRWHIFVIAPEIEGLIFRDRSVVNELVGYTVTETDFISGQFEPKKTLNKLLNQKPLLRSFKERLPFLNLEKIKKLPEINDLRAFIQGANTKHRVPQPR